MIQVVRIGGRGRFGQNPKERLLLKPSLILTVKGGVKASKQVIKTFENKKTSKVRAHAPCTVAPCNFDLFLAGGPRNVTKKWYKMG